MVSDLVANSFFLKNYRLYSFFCLNVKIAAWKFKFFFGCALVIQDVMWLQPSRIKRHQAFFKAQSTLNFAEKKAQRESYQGLLR